MRIWQIVLRRAVSSTSEGGLAAFRAMPAIHGRPAAAPGRPGGVLRRPAAAPATTLAGQLAGRTNPDGPREGAPNARGGRSRRQYTWWITFSFPCPEIVARLNLRTPDEFDHSRNACASGAACPGAPELPASTSA